MISRIVPIQGAIRALCRAKQVCCPPQAREVGFKWVSTQRSNYEFYQEGYPSPMTEERIRELESLGVELKIGLKSIWSARFQELWKYKKQLGHCLVPQRYAGNPKLGYWVGKQRTSFRLYKDGKFSHMTEELIRELDNVGFHWKAGKNCASILNV